jgi:hypothetical protein
LAENKRLLSGFHKSLTQTKLNYRYGSQWELHNLPDEESSSGRAYWRKQIFELAVMQGLAGLPWSMMFGDQIKAANILPNEIESELDRRREGGLPILIEEIETCKAEHQDGGIRNYIFEIIVLHALVNSSWTEMCAGPMGLNDISVDEVQAEVERRMRRGA